MEDALQRCTLQGVTFTGNNIGSGAWGMLQEVLYCGVVYVAKEIPSILYEINREHGRKIRYEFLAECYHHSEFRHPNIVQFIGVCFDRRGLPRLVMEKMEHNLSYFVEANAPIPLHKVLSILHDISLGVWYLHNRDPPIMHRDLSPNNVLLHTSGALVAKISDFGVMRVAPPINSRDEMTKAPGTLAFMPPEALIDKPVYGLPLDVFSFGGVVLFTIAGEWPTPTDQVTDLKTYKTVALTEVERRHHYLDKIRENATMLRVLVEECLNNTPDKRPTMENVSTRIKEIKEDYVKQHPNYNVSKFISIFVF